MIKPEIETDIGGKMVRLALPIGGLEEIAVVNPVLGELAQCLAQGVARYDELKAIINAGLKYGDGKEKNVTFEDVYNAVGVMGIIKIAIDLLSAAFGPVPEGKPMPEATSGSE